MNLVAEKELKEKNREFVEILLSVLTILVLIGFFNIRFKQWVYVFAWFDVIFKYVLTNIKGTVIISTKEELLKSTYLY